MAAYYGGVSGSLHGDRGNAAAERRFLVWLGCGFGAIWLWLAIDPVDRHVWMLENMLTAVGCLMMLCSYYRFPLSRLSYACIFVFALLHAWGAHHTYSLTPYDAWSRRLLGFSVDELLGFERNQYDRLIHFLWGLLIAYPARELLVRMARLRGFWGYAVPQLLVMASSVLYELIEWFAAETFGGDLGVQYLGTQGDEFDGQKDMALASLGSVATLAFAATVNGVLDPEFRAQWRASLSARDTEPLGERALQRLLQRRRGHTSPPD
jgi:putative membrane protein